MKQNDDRMNTNRLLAVLATAVLLMAAIYWAVTHRLEQLDAHMAALEARSNEVIQQYARRESLANDIRLHAEQSEGKLSLIFFVASKERRVPVYAEMDNYNKMIDDSLEKLAPLLKNPEEQQILLSLQAVRTRFRDNMQETVDALELNDRDKAEMLLSTITRENLQEIRSLVDRLASLQQRALDALQKEVVEKENETGSTLLQTRDITIGLGLLSGFIVLISGIMLGRRWARTA